METPVDNIVGTMYINQSPLGTASSPRGGRRSYKPSTQHSKSRNSLHATPKAVFWLDLGGAPLGSQADGLRSLSPARRLLDGARRAVALESEQLGREVTVMDVVLDHRLLLTRAAELPPHHHRVLPICKFECQGDIDGYWAWQGAGGDFVSEQASRHIEPRVSAERSTLTWSPSLDGDGVWDSGQ
ncbi:hypothetical protein PAXRUDRAFT_191359 [Paxillus rubicundulus Ve08.2h10]|uniref:Uncharacterized protein n=1 Tax=Paxillus rubicundulus Ve08.2h10 TaxID=930991 RepID=A0A0D0DNL2_9AGAM|nr:hypothetical protein PAXRUDRAFT_191359 [Paxillus rubicundulus Ve08.2h10]